MLKIIEYDSHRNINSTKVIALDNDKTIKIKLKDLKATENKIMSRSTSSSSSKYDEGGCHARAVSVNSSVSSGKDDVFQNKENIEKLNTIADDFKQIKRMISDYITINNNDNINPPQYYHSNSVPLYDTRDCDTEVKPVSYRTSKIKSDNSQFSQVIAREPHDIQTSTSFESSESSDNDSSVTVFKIKSIKSNRKNDNELIKSGSKKLEKSSTFKDNQKREIERDNDIILNRKGTFNSENEIYSRNSNPSYLRHKTYSIPRNSSANNNYSNNYRIESSQARNNSQVKARNNTVARNNSVTRAPCVASKNSVTKNNNKTSLRSIKSESSSELSSSSSLQMRSNGSVPRYNGGNDSYKSDAIRSSTIHKRKVSRSRCCGPKVESHQNHDEAYNNKSHFTSLKSENTKVYKISDAVYDS